MEEENTSTRQLTPSIEELQMEYDHLRQGILHSENLTNQILGAVVLLVTVLISVAFSESVPNPLLKAFLFFLAQIIAIVGLWQTLERERSIFVTASYLRTLIEPKVTGLKWETRLEKFRIHSQKTSGILYYIDYQLFTYPFLIAINYLFSIGHFMYGIYNLFSFPVTYIAIVLALIDGLLTWWFVRKTWRLLEINTIHHAEIFDPVWLNIKRDEEQSQQSVDTNC